MSPGITVYMVEPGTVVYDKRDLDVATRLAEQRDRARALACRLEEELALIRRSLSKAHRL